MNKLLLATLVLGTAGGTAQAVSLYEKDDLSVNMEIESMIGVFSTREDYLADGGKNWQEAYFKASVIGEATVGPGLRLRGGVGGITVGTWGDGDAGGYTRGDERRTRLENAWVGLKTADGLIDFSAGRQTYQLGDGFLIAGDAISLGRGPLLAGAQVNRGGAYYLAGQKSFDNTAILRLNSAGEWRGELFWLKSDNPYHQNTELAGVNVEHVDARATLGVSYLNILDVSQDRGLGLWNQREGMNVFSVRGQGNAGVENLFLSFEYVAERGGDWEVKNHAHAWTVEGGWTFSALPWKPSLNYRHAHFSADDPETRRNEAFDPLFFGLSRGFGTWFQGEIASNYAGPANSGNRVDRLEAAIQPREDLSVTLQYWDIRHVAHAPDLDGREIDLFAMWQINDYVTFIPLAGYYKPRGDDVIAAQGNRHGNFFAKAIVLFSY
ncbi:MAG: alginate export family protein [Azoarcus sp.]|jgi:hypothetical protein|nr:alginate export family protein [Azoarcus sp.]